MPDVPESERTPLVRRLLEIIDLQQERILQLEERPLEEVRNSRTRSPGSRG